MHLSIGRRHIHNVIVGLRRVANNTLLYSSNFTSAVGGVFSRDPVREAFLRFGFSGRNEMKPHTRQKEKEKKHQKKSSLYPRPPFVWFSAFDLTRRNLIGYHFTKISSRSRPRRYTRSILYIEIQHNPAVRPSTVVSAIVTVNLMFFFVPDDIYDVYSVLQSYPCSVLNNI